MGLFDALRSSSENGFARDASVSDPSLDQLRTGDVLDYDGRTWAVTRHERFDHEEGHPDRWTLTCGEATRLLDHGPGGSGDFHLFQRATLADVAVNGQPFLKAVQNGEAPDAIEYRGARYELTDTDVRTGLQDKQEIQVRSGRSLTRARLDHKLGGVFGGLGTYLGMPSVLLRVVALLGMIGLLAAGIAVGQFSFAMGGAVALVVVGAYVAAMLALPSERLSVGGADAPLSRYGLYEGEEGVVVLECWGENDWRAYEGRAASPDEFENILPGEGRREETDPEAGVGTALRRLREASLVDYEGSTWKVTRHATYVNGGRCVDQWTLQQDGDARLLEAEDDAGSVFRVSEPISLTDVTIDGRPFLKAVPEEPPSTVAYQGTEYALAEEDARISSTMPPRRADFWTRSRTDRKLAGVFAGIAEQYDWEAEELRSKLKPFWFLLIGASFLLAFLLSVLKKNGYITGEVGLWTAGVVFGSFFLPWPVFAAVYFLLFLSMPEAPPRPSKDDRIRFWRYESDDGFVVLECRGENEWSAHAGREVAPHEFENVRSRGGKGLLTSLWDTRSSSAETGLSRAPSFSESSLNQLRVGDVLDHDNSTWAVTRHEQFTHIAGPADRWTLTCGDETRLLDRAPGGSADVQFFRRATLADVRVEGRPFLKAVQNGEAPDAITYQGDRYERAEMDVRTGLQDKQEVQDRSGRSNMGARARGPLSHYWLYEGEEDVVVLECWGERDWRAYEGRAASPDEFENILSGEGRTEATDPEAGVGTALRRLREGSLVDYEGSTWEVSRHATYEGGKGPIDRWTLRHGEDVQILAHKDDVGSVFRLSRSVPIADVSVGDRPFLSAVSDEEPPSTVAYQGTEYVLAQEETRTSFEGDRIRFWRYESDDGFVVLECRGENEWSAHAGREVAPHEFENIRLRGGKGFTASPRDTESSSAETGLSRAPSISDPSLDQLRAGDMLDHDDSTWAVTRHERFAHEVGPVDRWTLTSGDETRLLNHAPGGSGDFHLFQRATPADVAVEDRPFLKAVQNGEVPDAVEYRGARYELTEMNARAALQAEQEVEEQGGQVRAEQSNTRARADASLSHYWLYEGEEGVVALECWGESDWRAYEGRAASPDEFDNILPGERRTEETDPEAGVGTALRRLREGSLVDYEGSTWEVSRHATYEGGKWPIDRWTLQHGGDVRMLEHEEDAGSVFRLSAPVNLAEVTIDGRPFLNAVPENSPGTVAYQGTEYVLAQEESRTPFEGDRIRFWRYESDDGFIVLECRGENEWSAHAGREVAPHEFENVLPESEEGGLPTLWNSLSTLWDGMSLSGEAAPPERSGGTALHRLKEGYALDHDLQMWTVTEHTKYPYEGWPSDVWTLESDGEERELEYDPREGGTFRLYRHVPVGQSFVETVGRGGTPLDEIEYEGTQYVLTENDARVHEEGRFRDEDHINFLARSLVDRWSLGVFGGIARHLGLPSGLVRLVPLVGFLWILVALLSVGPWAIILLPLFVLLTWGGYRFFALFVPEAPPKVLSHYWVYESDEGSLLALRCAQGTWTARVGRTVEPYEFDNILPSGDR